MSKSRSRSRKVAPRKLDTVKLPNPESLNKAIAESPVTPIEHGRVVGPVVLADVDTEKDTLPPSSNPPYMDAATSQQAFFDRLIPEDSATKKEQPGPTPGHRLLKLLRVLSYCHLDDLYLEQLTAPTQVGNQLCYPWQATMRFADGKGGPIQTLTGIATSPGMAIVNVLNRLEHHVDTPNRAMVMADLMIAEELAKKPYDL